MNVSLVTIAYAAPCAAGTQCPVISETCFYSTEKIDQEQCERAFSSEIETAGSIIIFLGLALVVINFLSRKVTIWKSICIALITMLIGFGITGYDRFLSEQLIVLLYDVEYILIP